jgi:hypothetical protein
MHLAVAPQQAGDSLLHSLNGYYSISLRSLYLWCDMSTFIFQTSYLAVLQRNLEIFCRSLDTK